MRWELLVAPPRGLIQQDQKLTPDHQGELLVVEVINDFYLLSFAFSLLVSFTSF